MTVTLSSLPSISPVYCDNLVLNASGSTGNTCYYNFTIVVNSVTGETFSYPANPSAPYIVSINLSTILSTYFTSNVYIPSYPYQLMEKISNSIIPYYIIAKLYTANNTLMSTVVSTTYYTFNGGYNAEDNFAMTDYIMTNGSHGNFLTNWNTSREITFNDLAYINVLTGQYGTALNTAFSGIKITKYQANGTSAYITSGYTDNTTKTLVNINVSPSVINSHYPNFIDSNTLYYTIEDLNGYTKQQMTITLVQENKITNFYNFLYINKVGGVDFYTFTKVSNQQYNITRNVLDQYLIQKTYYTNADKSIVAQSQFLSAYMADKLKELYFSPAIYVWFNNKLTPVRIITNSLPVLDRYPKDKFQQFTVEFSFLNKNYVQQY
jgi:hypothetical protein